MRFQFNECLQQQKMISNDEPDVNRHRIMSTMICAISEVYGFKNIETFALETLTELMKSFLLQFCIQTKSNAELQGRVEPTYHDVAASLIELGIDLSSLFKYIRVVNARIPKNKIAKPPTIPVPSSPKRLRVAQPRAHPNFIDNQFPSFPDPHTYIVTETEFNNEREYQKSREQIATQKMNMEKGLVKFKIKSELESCISLLKDDQKEDVSFHLLANRPQILPYYKALLPHDEHTDILSEIQSKKTSKNDNFE